jgi:DNA-binding NarL/FixJ family response regulator
MFRQAMNMVLSRERQVSVVGEAANGREAVSAVLALRPDICLMDVAMPKMNGIEATGQIRAEAPGTQVIMLSQYSAPEQVMEALQAGARGYVVKDAAIDELVQAVRAVHRGHPFLSAAVLDPIIQGYLAWSRQVSASPLRRLTPREQQVMKFIAQGSSTQEIAKVLGISPRTVETHRHSLMKKLGLHNAAEVALLAVKQGLVQVSGLSGTTVPAT